MISFVKPEEAGISSASLRRFLARVQKAQINLHSVVMMRGNSIFFEKYWAPFTPDFAHRMYSVTKSFVSTAIGFLEQEGKLKLDDPIIKYFPDKLGEEVDPLLAMQTIRDMLTMRTCFAGGNWFVPAVTDRLKFYFQRKADKVPGTVFFYDSNGSYVLGCLVERLSGKKLLDYLKEKVLDRIGCFENAHMLSTIDGTPWGDSALLCSARALAVFARFILNYGSWEGEQLLNADYLKAATTAQTANDNVGKQNYNVWGYGYQFWMTEQNAFSFNGMGGQFAICVPGKDLIFVCNADDQLSSVTDSPRIFEAFFEEIVNHADGEEPCAEELPLDTELKLSVAKGEAESAFSSELNGKTFQCAENPMGIRWIRLTFQNGRGELQYENAQGEKCLAFGMKENVFTRFPQFGYSDEYGNLHEQTDFLYRCAVSAGWIEPQKLQIRVQIVDRYMGLLTITLGFRGTEWVTVCMEKCAEDFLNEYNGWAYGKGQ